MPEEARRSIFKTQFLFGRCATNEPLEIDVLKSCWQWLRVCTWVYSYQEEESATKNWTLLCAVKKNGTPTVRWSIDIVQLSKCIFGPKRVSRYGRCFIANPDTMTYPELESGGCHSGTRGEKIVWAKTKWPPSDNVAGKKYSIAFLIMVLEIWFECLYLCFRGPEKH